MEVVTLAKLWGRVEGTPPKPSLRSWGLRTSALPCTSVPPGGNSSPSEPGGYWGTQPPSATSWLGSWGLWWFPAGDKSQQGTGC